MDGIRTKTGETQASGDAVDMLWQHYVLRRGLSIQPMWDSMFERRPIRLLYVTGEGFDIRAHGVLDSFVTNVRESQPHIERATLLLVGFKGYELSEDLRLETTRNGAAMASTFSEIGESRRLTVDSSVTGNGDVSASTALRQGAEKVLAYVDGQTDIVLDVSSMPRVVYMTLLTGILHRILGENRDQRSLFGKGVNFQVLVGEDPVLDSAISSEDPSNDLILIPGFASALHAESVQDWPIVWFPILGEGKVGQMEKVMQLAIPTNAEICPVLPHPSRDLRRADRLLVQYRQSLIDVRGTPMSSILLAHESHPFEAYRQLYNAMSRYRESMRILGGCRLVVTPLASKLITIGAALACFEMRPSEADADYGVAIPYAEPTRYDVPIEVLRATKPEISAMLLTGQAYEQRTT